MKTDMRRLALAAAALVVWVALTVGISIRQAGPNTPLGVLVQERIVLSTLVAATFMLLVVHVNGWWKDVGFRAPQPSRSIFLLWLPALYIAVLIAFGMFVTPPTASVMAIVAINTLVVGFSEELAFRGVLWGAVRRFMPFWSGFLLVCAAFGSIHILNGFLTGEWGAAATQSVNAVASGAAYLAFRIRNRSIIPIMVIHWLWDFAVFIVGAGSDPVAASAIDPFKSLTYSAMLVGPILLCGLFLIRNERVRAGWRDDSLPGA